MGRIAIDPLYVTTAIWQQLVVALFALFLFLVSVVSFAFCLLIAHAAVPSLLATRDMSARFGVLRPVFYALAAVAFVAIIFAALNVFSTVQVVYDIYPKKAI